VVEGGGIDVLLEISDSNKCRTLLLRTTKTLAAYQLGKERSWKQLHTDETGRRQKQLVNVVINIINESGDFKSICLSGSIIAEDSTAEEQSRSIIASFGEAGQLLHEWKDVTLEMFPRRQDLIDMIPDPSDMSPTKLLSGMVSTDTCNTARLTRQTLCDAIIKEGREAGLEDDKLLMFQGNCHQHLRNILADAGENHLSSKLTELLCDDLAIIIQLLCRTSHVARLLSSKNYSRRDHIGIYVGIQEILSSKSNTSSSINRSGHPAAGRRVKSTPTSSFKSVYK
jgi:hypothetical protein